MPVHVTLGDDQLDFELELFADGGCETLLFTLGDSLCNLT